MNWFQQDRLLSGLLVGFGIALVSSVWLLLVARGDWSRAASEFRGETTELKRLESLVPYPSGENLRQFKAEVYDYGDVLVKLKEEIKGYVLPVDPMAPNEFQARLHSAITSLEEKAQVAKVKLPERFYLGFDEFAAALPNALVAPLLGQELAQIERLFDILIEARVDAVTAFRRVNLPEEQGTVLVPTLPNKSGTIQKLAEKPVERNLVEISFIAGPAAARKILNQIATDRQFFVMRLLEIRNEKDKGPAREIAVEAAAVNDSASSTGSVSSAEKGSNAPLTFIVGNEHIEVSSKIEIVRFSF